MSEHYFFSGPTVSLDCLSGARSFVERNWGDYGYRVGIESASLAGGAVFVVSHRDGQSRILVDRWGNAAYYAAPAPDQLVCYSDHDEDIRTKGSCDYCAGR